MALRILPIFGRGQEKAVVELFRQHMKKILEMNSKLRTAVKNLIQGGYKKVQKLVIEIGDLESEADKLRKTIEIKLYEGAFLPESRRQLYMVCRWMDEVADAVEDAADALVYMKNVKPPKPFAQLFSNMSKHTYDSVNLLKDLLEAVLENKEGVQFYMAKISDAESFVDDLKVNLLKYLFIKSDLRAKELIILKRCVDKMDNVADKAEDCGDYITLLKIMKQA